MRATGQFVLNLVLQLTIVLYTIDPISVDGFIIIVGYHLATIDSITVEMHVIIMIKYNCDFIDPLTVVLN